MLKKLYLLFLIALSIICVQNASGQLLKTDSVLVTKEVIISSNRLSEFSTGYKIIEIDSATLAQNQANSLAELLSNYSPIFVKTYGTNSLASTSVRGMNANQTAILWNGFNINSSYVGMIDLNLVPNNFVNSAKIQVGGAGALWGSGAIGGTVHLNNQPTFNKGLTFNTLLNTGSFADQQINIDFSFSKKRFITSFKTFYHQAKNDFPFINNAKIGKPIENFQNSESYQKGILQENYFKLTKNQTINTRVWLQNNHRHIPNSITSGIGKAFQNDQASRFTTEWQLIKSNITLFARAAFFNENIDYYDPSTNLTSLSNIKTIISEAETKYKITDLQTINGGINFTYNKALTKNYSFIPERNRTSLFSSYQIRNNKSTLKLTTSVRKEFVNQFISPFTYSFGGEAKISQNIKTRINVSKNYRLPTFNDLYWGQGGNPNLLPEEGVSTEIGIGYVKCSDPFAIEFETSFFSSNVNNWIMWAPDNKGVWTPQNINKVWSRGVEMDLKLYATLGKIKWVGKLQAHYIKTTNEKSNTKETLHKQLIYTPLYKILSSISAEYKKYRLNLAYNFVGYRFENTDNATFLPGYGLVNIDFSKQLNLKNQTFRAFLQINNVTNFSYQIIPFYPSPMRNYQIGISINLNKPNKI